MTRLLSSVVGVVLLIAASQWACNASAAALTVAESVDLVTKLKAGGTITSVHPRTGRLIFIGTEPGRRINLDLQAAVRATLPERPSALDYMNLFAPSFGLDNPGADARVVKVRSDEHVSHTRFQQTHGGLPVIGGEFIVNLDAAGNLLSMSGKAAPGLQVGTTPALDSAQAQRIALGGVAKWHRLDPGRLRASDAALSVFYPSLLDGGGVRPARLVWRIEIGSQGLDPVREFVLVDALTGAISLHFNRVHTARDRMTYDAASTAVLPGTLVCDESNSTCNGVADAVNAHLFAADTYDYYQSHFGRDSIDGAGMTLVSTVRSCPTGESCPYENLFWNGTQMVYGEGFSSADDLVAHELTHGVTERESGLFYWYQSGAINEALSDIFGEFVDQANGHGNDAAGVKWLIGEDLPLSIGPIRSMSDPTVFADPDRMTSAYYYTDVSDNGGVHWNSGVANKSAYLMAAGDTFNGKTIAALGNDKVARIWYEAQVNLLISSSDYLDLYNALHQACTNLVGTSGVTADDCQQVRNATDAVEMNLEPVPGFLPEADTCAPGQTPVTLFFDNLEAGDANWVKMGSLNDLGGYPNWGIANWNARSAPNSIYGQDSANGPYDASMATASSIAVPAGAYLRFEHAFGFEYYPGFYDGGVVEYSIDGGSTWIAMDPDSGQGYGGTLSTSYGNPLGGTTAFVAESHGYVSSRFDLSPLAGNSARFRFRIGVDDGYSSYGWYIDNVHVYTCAQSGLPPPVLTGAVSRKVHGSAGTFDLALSLVPTNPTTEPRTGAVAGNHTIVFVFDRNVTGGTASVTAGPGVAGAPSFSTNEMTLPLTGVTNQQYVTVGVSAVSAADGGTGGAGSVRVGFLSGDVSVNRVVTLADVLTVNSALAQAVTIGNFLRDVNSSGTLTLADKLLTNSQLTKSLPAP